ncbi:MAG TPA: hypothetical protein VHO06_21435 [Polyangia bacterium]|nr:hypothetical protein [Polyangia bacterium]
MSAVPPEPTPAQAPVPPPTVQPAAESSAARAPWLSRLLRGWRGAVVVYLVFAGAYLGASGGRLRMHSQYNHYVYLADGWLHGRLTLAGPPPNENDWAKIDVLKLKDGRELRGIYGGRIGGPSDRLYPLRGPSFTVPPAEIASRSTIRLVSFPPFPAVAMLPFVAIWGLQYNDVLFTALWAAANPMLLFLLLRVLRARGLSRRSEVDDLWLTAMFGVGSVYYFCSVVGEVWFTAQIIAVTLCLGYVWASLEARRPVLAGIFVALGFATRPPWLVVPFFLFEAVRAAGGRAALRDPEARRALIGTLLRFAAPVVVGGMALAAYNYARFENPFEFGHRFMPVQWQDRMFRFGLFNYHFLSRNLACALVLLPRIMDRYPYVRISQHGMSLLVTSPNLAYTVMPQERSPLTKALWITILTTALPSLLYQNSGYVQWGYRFSLDYMIYFMVLLAVGNRPLTKLFRVLVVVAFAINLFLAVGFDRYTQFSYDDSFFPHGNN